MIGVACFFIHNTEQQNCKRFKVILEVGDSQNLVNL